MYCLLHAAGLAYLKGQTNKLSERFGSLIEILMDDYMSLNIAAYAGDKQQQYSTTMDVNKESHEMFPKENYNQAQSNQCFSGGHAKQDIAAHQKMIKRILIFMAVLVAMVLFVSLAAIGLSIINYNASESNTDDLTSLTTTVDAAINKFAISLQAEVIRLHCGAGEWYRVAYLNMSDPSQQCPSTWREYNKSNQFRACGRPVSTVATCPSHFYPTHRHYSKVCGRIIGIQVASPDAFRPGQGINGVYIDGVSITYGSPRNHIWTFAGSISEITTDINACPCDNSGGNRSQSFVGNNYYCESGNPNQEWEGLEFPNDKLWDGQQCSHEGTCCTGANTPPWFSMSFRSPASDDIEVRICGSQSTIDEDTPIELLEIYVQ